MTLFMQRLLYSIFVGSFAGMAAPLTLEYMGSTSGVPCIESLVSPVSTSKNCRSFVGNVSSAPTYFAPLQLIVSGSASENLLVSDARNGKQIVVIPAEGRVVTPVLFAKDSGQLFFGTEKGIVQSINAFSYEKRAVFNADSQVNSDIHFFNDTIIFSTMMGTIYCLEQKDLSKKWKIKNDRVMEGQLHLASYARWMSVQEKGANTVIMARPMGELSFINAKEGKVTNTLQLGMVAAKEFADIVAPMVWLNGTLFVASYDLGLFAIDPQLGQIKRSYPAEKKIIQLATDGQALFAATKETLFALDSNAQRIWVNHFGEIYTKRERYGFPFDKYRESPNKLFIGSVSNLWVVGKTVILTMDEEGIGLFNGGDGKFVSAISKLGVGPNFTINDENNIFAVTRLGTLIKLSFESGI